MSLLLWPSLSYLPVLGLISTCPLGQTSAKGKTTRGVCTMLGIDWLSGSPRFSVWLCCRPAHDRGALGCFPIPTLGHPLRTGCLSQVADVRPRMRTAAGGGQVHRPQQLAFLHCEPVNAQNFFSTPRGSPIKMILHSLPANRTCKQARKSGRLGIIMNSKWKGVVRDCFS